MAQTWRPRLGHQDSDFPLRQGSRGAIDQARGEPGAFAIQWWASWSIFVSFSDSFHKPPAFSWVLFTRPKVTPSSMCAFLILNVFFGPTNVSSGWGLLFATMMDSSLTFCSFPSCSFASGAVDRSGLGLRRRRCKSPLDFKPKDKMSQLNGTVGQGAESFQVLCS